VDPPDELNINNSDKSAFTLYGSLILDQIWKVRNLKVYEGTEVEIVKLMRNLANLDREHFMLKGFYSSSMPRVRNACWQKPLGEEMKLNCDAAMGCDFSTIAIVARDWRGTVVLALTKKVNTTIPLEAEVEALAWAVFVAADLGVERVTIESDSKSCVDCIHRVVSDASWRINGILSNMSTLFRLHPLWSTSWVSRVANQAAYELFGWSQKSRF
jgi:ribonuclease HI